MLKCINCKHQQKGQFVVSLREPKLYPWSIFMSKTQVSMTASIPFNPSPFVRCSVYNKPEAKFMQGSNYKKQQTIIALTHSQQYKFTSAQCTLNGNTFAIFYVTLKYIWLLVVNI
jgi:hypothetical protein